MDYQEMVRRLYGLADVGIVNAKADTQLLRDAALFIDCQQLKIEAMKEKIYELEERLAIMEDGNALSLLKAQEPTEPGRAGFPDASRSYGTWHYICGACGGAIDYKDKFCRWCGRAVKWDD